MTHNEMAKGGGIKQTRPQETDSTYSKAIDKQVSGKPVGYRFTDKLAKKLGKKPGTKPTAAEIEKYKNRGVYFETRKNKSDINPKAKLEGGGDMEYVKGGTIASIVKKFKPKAIKHDGNSKDGYSVLIKDKNSDFQAWIDVYIDERHKDVSAEWNKYIFHLDDENDVRDKAVMENDDVFLDSMSESINYLSDKGFIRNDDKANWHYTKRDGGDVEYAKGGQTAPQRESYSKRGDKEVKAKPVGYRFTEKLANRLGKNVYTKPTQEQVEKYRGRGVYFENRKDKSDVNPRAMFMHGGHNDEVLGNGRKLDHFTAVGIAEGFVEKQDWNDELKAWAYIQRHGLTRSLQGWFGRTAEEMIDRGLFDRKGNIDWEVANEIWDEDDEYAKGGQTSPQRESYSKRGDKEVKAKPVGYRFTEKLANRLGKNVFTKPTQEQVEKYRGRGVYFENRKDKSDINPRAMFEEGGDMEYARGGQTAPQRESYSRRGDKEVSAKPVGYRFTNALAKRLGKKVTTRPSMEEVRKYLGKGIYFENRKDKSDVNPKAKLMGGGDTDYAKGGQTAPQETDSTYSKSIDKRVSGKPVGYRFTNKLANKLGKKPFTRPTSSEVDKYSGKGVYFETRKNKSDINPKAKLEGGGESEYARGGGVPRTSNSDSKAYTENHLPFMANNLEGKTLENGDYVVLSYGYYPIWFWHKRTNKWYGNKDKFSVTTAKHISQSRPTYDAQMLSRGEMDNLMSKSIEGKDFKEMGGTLESFEVAQP